MMNKLKESKWVYVLLSVLLATLFWMYVRSVQDPSYSTTYHNIPLEVVGLNVLQNQGLTVSEVSHETVSVSIRAPLSVINSLSRDSIRAELDVSKCGKEGQYDLTFKTELPNNINLDGAVIESQTPDTVTVTVAKMNSKSFDVQLLFRGSVAEGYQSGTESINPETVTVTGPADQVSQVASVAAVLEAQDLSERFSDSLPLVLLDAEGNELEDLEVELSVDTVYVTLPIVVVKEVPLSVVFLPGGGANEQNISYEIYPETITVAGAEEDLASLNEICLKTIDLSTVIGTSTFSRPIELDASLENVTGITEATVTVTVEGLATRTIEVDNIQVINEPSEYHVSIITLAQEVTIRGDQEVLDTIEKSQLKIVADLSNISAVGIHTVQAKVYLNANNLVGVIGDYSIVVNITQ